MAQCKFCGNKGFLLGVNKEGLCKHCAPAVIEQIVQCHRVVKESNDIINTSKQTATRISRCDTILGVLDQLYDLENKGIPTITPPPTELFQIITEKRDDIIYSSVKDDVEKLINKAELASTIKTSLNSANNALLKIIEAKKLINDTSQLNEIESRVKEYTHKIQLKSFLDEANKAEFKGNLKKALDQYQEALYFLKNDNIDDAFQRDEISRIENKIEEIKNL